MSFQTNLEITVSLTSPGEHYIQFYNRFQQQRHYLKPLINFDVKEQ